MACAIGRTTPIAMPVVPTAIDQLFDEIAASTQKDQLTSQLKTHPLPRDEETLLNIIEGILIEEWKGLPNLDPQLGSDGHIYCGQLLRLRTAYVPDADLIDGSPIDNSPHFWVEEHQALQACKRYFEACGREVNNPQVTEECDRLGVIALPLPNGHNTETIKQLRQRRQPLFTLRQKTTLAKLKLQLVEAEEEALKMKALRQRVALLTDEKRVRNAVFCSDTVKLALKRLLHIKAECQQLSERAITLEVGIEQLRQSYKLFEELNEQLEAQIDEMIAENAELKKGLGELRKAFKKVLKAKRTCFVVSVGMHVLFGPSGSLIDAVLMATLEQAIQIVAGKLIKNEQLAGIVAGITTGGLFNPTDRLKGAVKGGLMTTFDTAASAAGLHPAVRGATSGAVGSCLGGNTDLIPQNMLIGAGLVGVSTGLPISVSGTLDGKGGMKMTVRADDSFADSPQELSAATQAPIKDISENDDVRNRR